MFKKLHSLHRYRPHHRGLRFCITVLLLFLALDTYAVAPKYPAIQEWQGEVWLTGKDGKRQLLHKKQPLREKALLETSATGQVTVQLDEKRTVILMKSSELSIPIIGWDRGEAPVLILKNGDLQWIQKLNEKGEYNIALTSDLFEFLSPPGNFIFSIDTQKAFAQVKVFDGSIEFSALNGEDSVLVQKGHMAGFQGVIEGDAIAYDVLLKGKKIPKGSLTQVSAISAEEMAKMESKQKKLRQDIKVRVDKEKAQEKNNAAGIICDAPAGKFNDCAWICLNNPKKEKKACLLAQPKVSCVRRRCNANGQWAEESIMSTEGSKIKCKVQPTVGTCDY
ncbi:MAG: hypothetical protein ACXVCY_14210 [Pseudobdellovibrionaceae bacterium]